MFLLPVQSIFQEETAAPMRGRVFSARFALTRVAYMVSVSILSFAAVKIEVGRVYQLAGLTLLIGTLMLFGLKNASHFKSGNCTH